MNLAEVVLSSNIQSFVVGVRHYLHRRPETRWEENVSLEYVREQTRRMEGLVFIKFDGGYVFDYNVEGATDRILLRADIDALPVKEATGLSFASKVEGVMHACGHDTHAAMLLGAMMLIAEGTVKPTHNLRFVFQRAEENPGTTPKVISGGASLVEGGVLAGVSRAYGLHIWPSGEPGVFYSRPGALLGNSGRFKLLLKGTGGHVAQPHKGSNVLRMYADVARSFDTIGQRWLSPTEPVSVEPVIARCGTGSNVMPAEGEFWWGVRTMLPRNQHAGFMDAMEEEVAAIVSRYQGASFEAEKIMGHPALINDATDVARVSAGLRSVGQQVESHDPILGGEDFAHYLYKVPGSFWFLGAHQQGTGDCHAPTFNPDESVLWRGVLFWLLLATSPEV